MKKIGWVALIVVGVILAYIIMLSSMDFIRESAEYASGKIGESEYSEHYALSHAATSSAPYWLLFIPVAVGGISVIVVLRQH